MTDQITVNVPDAAPAEHQGEALYMSVDEHRNLVVNESWSETENGSTLRRNKTLAIYAQGFWADAVHETLEG